MFSSIIMVAVVSFLVCVANAVILIPFLRKLNFGQSIREDGPQGHLKKEGTPTMGGLIMFLAVLVTIFMFTGYDKIVGLCLLLFLGYGAIGFADDFIKVVMKRNLGLTARQKLLAQAVIAIVFIYFTMDKGTALWIPFVDETIDIGFLHYLLVFVLLIGTTNSVNLTDGLDGLLAGATVPVLLAYVVIASTLGSVSLTIFAMALLGACLGFLVFNFNPAKVFMGDTGSLALGGGIAALALLTNTELLLVVIGGLYVVEAMSVVLQVASFKSTGKRIFRMSPIHHHFELSGWGERKVVLTFWLVSAVFSLLGLLIWLR